jgi:hypothetical protein
MSDLVVVVLVRDEVGQVVFHDRFAGDGAVATEDDVVVRVDVSGVVVAGCQARGTNISAPSA